jgi:hypothetical protein
MPIDYLDFASPVSGLGSKMGLDATDKFPGETNREWGRQIRMDQAVIDKVYSIWASWACRGAGRKSGSESAQTITEGRIGAQSTSGQLNLRKHLQ